MAVTKLKLSDSIKYNAEFAEKRYSITFDTSYPTGGEECDFSSDFPRGINSVLVEANSSGYLIASNVSTSLTKYATGKCDLQAFRQTAATGPLVEVPAATNLSTVVCVVVVRGPSL